MAGSSGAPAGWGKTSLLRDWWLAAQDSGAAWLSAGEGDNEPVRFWSLDGPDEDVLQALAEPSGIAHDQLRLSHFSGAVCCAGL